jgi:long-chain acyl-CoA synthetase
MDRFWLKSYPSGVPSDIDPSVYPSVVALIEESFAKYRDHKAYVCMDKAITFGEVDTLSQALAAWLQGRGLKRGARVAIMMPNVLQYPVAVAAVLRAGFIAVNVNPLYTAPELEHQLEDSGAEAVIVLENFASTLEQALRAGAGKTAVKHVVVASMGDLLGFPKGLIVDFMVRTVRKMIPAFTLAGHFKFNDVIAVGRSMALARPDLGPDDVAVLQYTGGTTGVAKGATLLHHTIVANLLASEAWMQPGLKRKQLTGQFTIVCAQHPDSQSARHEGHGQGARQVPHQHLSRGEHAVQRARQPARLRQARLLRARHLQRRRHGGAGSRRQEVARHHRLPDRRRLRPQRDLGRRHL